MPNTRSTAQAPAAQRGDHPEISREITPRFIGTRSRLSLMRFYPYSPADAAQLDAPAPPRIKTVTVDLDDAFLDAILARLKPDFIRLHGKETPKRMVEIKEPLAPASSRRYRLARRRFRRDEIIRAAGGSLLIRQRGTAECHAAGRLCPRLRLEIDAWAEHRQTLVPIVKNAKAPVELPVAKAPDVSFGVFSREGDGPHCAMPSSALMSAGPTSGRRGRSGLRNAKTWRDPLSTDPIRREVGCFAAGHPCRQCGNFASERALRRVPTLGLRWGERRDRREALCGETRRALILTTKEISDRHLDYQTGPAPSAKPANWLATMEKSKPCSPHPGIATGQNF
jgi:hypothetical protein